MGSCQSAEAAGGTTNPTAAKKNPVEAARPKTLRHDDSAILNTTSKTTISSGASTPPRGGNGAKVTFQPPSTDSCRSGESNRHERLMDWREELVASGNLTKSVVRIETSGDKRVEDIYDGIHNGPILGTGAAGVVRKCTHRETGIAFAVKCLNIGMIESDAIIETLREEIFIMCQADHPDILRLEEVYESDSQIYLILSLLTGGDMFDRLEDQPDYHYSEVQCAHIVKQMVSAVRYLHANKVVHRDLKLENFIFDSPESDSIRLIDFGLSKHFDHDGAKHNVAVGTAYTVAPEIIQGEYDEKVDVWALGVITYLLLCGDSPFGGMDGEDLVAVRQNILDCKLLFEPKYIWDEVSDEAKAFVRRLLTRDPEQRPSACEAAHDDWLVRCAKLDAEQSKPLDANLVKNLIEFKDYSNLQKVLLEVVSFTLIPEQIRELKQEFEKMDRDGSGEITLDTLKEVLLNYRSSDNTALGGGGSITEEEVELIFDSLSLNTKATTIKWHKFITAGLSQCHFDDRNLKLAFNRLDQSSKGFINIDDLNDKLRSKDGSMDEAILEMWKDGMTCVRCKQKDRIYFEDFQGFFKGSKKPEAIAEEACSPPVSSGSLHTEIRRSGRFNMRNRRMSSVRVLASAFALDDDAVPDRCGGGGDDEKADDLERVAEEMALSKKPPRRRSSKKAVLVMGSGSSSFNCDHEASENSVSVF